VTAPESCTNPSQEHLEEHTGALHDETAMSNEDGDKAFEEFFPCTLLLIAMGCLEGIWPFTP